MESNIIPMNSGQASSENSPEAILYAALDTLSKSELEKVSQLRGIVSELAQKKNEENAELVRNQIETYEEADPKTAIIRLLDFGVNNPTLGEYVFEMYCQKKGF